MVGEKCNDELSRVKLEEVISLFVIMFNFGFFNFSRQKSSCDSFCTQIRFLTHFVLMNIIFQDQAFRQTERYRKFFHKKLLQGKYYIVYSSNGSPGLHCESKATPGHFYAFTDKGTLKAVECLRSDAVIA